MATYRWEMGITREEFVRLLPVAVGGHSFDDRGDVVHGQGWRVRIAPMPHRRIALVVMPVLDVTLEMESDGEIAAAFVERFLLGYQRAGG